MGPTDVLRLALEIVGAGALAFLAYLALGEVRPKPRRETLSAEKAGPPNPSHVIEAPTPKTPKEVDDEAAELKAAREERKREQKGKKKDKNMKKAERKEHSAEDEKRGFKTVNEAWKNGHCVEIEVEEPDPNLQKFVFIVRRRFSNSLRSRAEPEEPKVFVNLYSPHLVRVLRKILKHDEDIFADVPLVLAQSIFLIRKELELYRDETVQRLPDASERKQGDSAAVDDKKEAALDDDSAEKKEVLAREDLQAEVDHLKILFDWLSEAFGAVQSKLDRMLPQNQISWSLLWYTFRRGSKVVVAHESTKEKLGVLIDQTPTYIDRGDHSSYFQAAGYYLIWDGRRYQKARWESRVTKFSGTLSLANLPMYPLSAKVEEELKQRGQLVVSFAGIKHLAYDGVLVQTAGSGLQKRVIKAPATGRVMIDVVAFRRKKPMMDIFRDEEDEYDDSNVADDFIDDISEDEYWSLPPTLHGFSFHLKAWGELSVERLSPVKFSRDSFEHLVLPDDQKRLIRGIVDATKPENQSRIVKDFISGKGEGITICLHGPPGSGKTLTAEAVGELLERPLYVVGSGELGTDAGAVEENLREVFDLAEAWSAVILIDEGDVFLETRSLHELARNSLVSTFLRLLDFSRATLFITTNRIRAFDPAVLSRVHAAFKYSSLDRQARLKVWTRFLQLAGVAFESDAMPLVNGATGSHPSSRSDSPMPEPGFSRPLYITRKELTALAAKSMDGRSIRNAVLSAQRIAISEKVPLSLDHIHTVIKYSESFLRDFKELDDEALYAAPGEGLHDKTRMYY